MISTKKTFITSFFACLVVYSSIHAGVYINGDDPNNPLFSFSLKTKAYSSENREFFVGAGEEQEGNTFALAQVKYNGTRFQAIARATANVNYTEDQDNPLYGKQIDFLSLLEDHPLAVTSAEPNRLSYMYFIGVNSVSLIQSSSLLDANGLDTSGIAGLSASGTRFYAAVRANGSTRFGQPGSGISTGDVKLTTQNDASPEYKFILVPYTVPLTISSPALTIGTNPLADINNDPVVGESTPVALHVEPESGRLYTGVLAQGNTGANDGARSVTLSSNKYICPDSCFAGGANYIIGQQGANVYAYAYKLASLYTSTRLPYLVIAGGVGDPAETKRKIYALPLVNDPNATYTMQSTQYKSYGMLASRNSRVQDQWYTDRKPNKFKARYFLDAAISPVDMYEPTDSAAQVGGSDLPSDITDIYALKDTIYVATADGIYYSQAIFGTNGVIKNWTKWQRTAGTAGPQYQFSLDANSNIFFVISGTNPAQPDAVYRTDWTPAQTGTAVAVSENFAQEQGGVQQCIDFPNTYPAFSQADDQRTALLMMTGYKKIMLAQSGRDASTNDFQASLQLTNYTEHPNGSINQTSNTMAISGGALDDLGAIKTATITTQAPEYWMCIAGSRGLAILAQPDGSGFPALTKDFGNLPTPINFKKILDIPNIRKIMAVGNELFILTSTQLLRTTISQAAIANNSFTLTQLANAQTIGKNIYSCFADMLISEKLALVSGSFGLIRSGNNVTIKIAQEGQANWSLIPFNDPVGSVTQLYPVTLDGVTQNFFNDTENNFSNIYVLSAYVGYSQARLYRLCIEPSDEVTDTTVQHFPDYFIQNASTNQSEATFFLNSAYYRNHCATDGTLLYLTRSKYEPNASSNPFVEAIPTIARSGVLNAARRRTTIFSVSGARSLENMLHCSGNGTWITAGDFGLRINE